VRETFWTSTNPTTSFAGPWVRWWLTSEN